MPEKVLALVGTKKGAFIFESNSAGKSSKVFGPYCEHWPLNHVVGDPEDRRGLRHRRQPMVWAGGVGVRDLGATWTHSSHGLAYAEGETPIKTGWSLAIAHGRVFAGVEPAGLFVSDDRRRELDAPGRPAKASFAATLDAGRSGTQPAHDRDAPR